MWEEQTHQHQITCNLIVCVCVCVIGGSVLGGRGAASGVYAAGGEEGMTGRAGGRCRLPPACHQGGAPSVEQRLASGGVLCLAAQRGGQLVRLRQKVAPGAQQHHHPPHILHAAEELM